MRWVRVLAIIAAMMGVRGALCAAGADGRPGESGRASIAAVDADDAGAMEGLVKLLGSGDVAERERGQAELEGIAVWKYRQVKLWAGKAEGAEAKARLEVRAGEMEDIAGFNPEPVNLRVKDATLKEVVAALNASTHVQFAYQDYQANEPGDVRFTLEAKGLPFCEVVSRLSAQHVLAMREEAQGLGFVLAGKDSALAILRGAVVSVTAGPANFFRGNGPAVVVRIVVATGPFSHQLSLVDGPYAASMDVELTDAATGKVLGKGQSKGNAVGSSAGSQVWTEDEQIPVGAIPGRVNISGKAVVPVAAEFREFLPAEHLNEKIVFGNNVIKVVAFEEGAGKADGQKPEPRELALRIEIAGDDGALAAPEPEGPGLLTLRYSGKHAFNTNLQVALQDAQGGNVWNTRLQDGSAALINGKMRLAYVSPLRLVISTGQSRTVTVPFEFKDVPVAK